MEAGMRGKRDTTRAATSGGLVPKVRVPAPMNRKPSAMLQGAVHRQQLWHVRLAHIMHRHRLQICAQSIR